MNSFVNPRKRGISLPGGAKNLSELLPRKGRARCEYCNAPSVAIHYFGVTDDRWCRECVQDLQQFAAMQNYKFDFDPNDEAAKSRHLADLQRRQDEFMRERIKARRQVKRPGK